MRRTLILLAALVGLASVAVAGSASAAGSQFTMFDATMQHTKSTYWAPTFNSPSDLTSPTNYAGGSTFWRVQVLTKPSTKPVDVQICMWRHGARKWQYETCSSQITNITTPGTYWRNLGPLQGWWKLNGSWDWSVPFDVLRVMVKDHATQKLLMTSACGTHCYQGSDIDEHTPITIDSEMIVVAKGATLDAPAGWTGCPAAWSPECPTPTDGGGGGDGTPTVSVADARKVEPDAGTKVSMPFRLTLSQPSASTVTVTVNIAPGTATPGVDYGNRGGAVTVSFAPGTTTKSVGFPIIGDNVKEPDETVLVTLTNPVGATIGDGLATGTIVNDD